MERVAVLSLTQYDVHTSHIAEAHASRLTSRAGKAVQRCPL